MPAARTIKSRAAAVSRVVPKQPIQRVAADTNGDIVSDEATLQFKVEALRSVKGWQEIVELLDSEAVFPLSSASLQSAYCRAFFHLKAPSSTTIINAKTTSASLLKTEAGSVDALICAGKIAQTDGEFKSVADRALEAYKASGYKDDDALELLKSGHSNGVGGRGSQGGIDLEDHYETLHVSRTAPSQVITAAHAALSLLEGSAEARSADEAVSVLSDPERRAQYDEELSRRQTGGSGREFTGGSELLKQLGEALGLVFPTGFVFPPSGRFQGGFGGGFEYTWGAAETVTAVETSEGDNVLKLEADREDAEKNNEGGKVMPI